MTATTGPKLSCVISDESLAGLTTTAGEQYEPDTASVGCTTAPRTTLPPDAASCPSMKSGCVVSASGPMYVSFFMGSPTTKLRTFATSASVNSFATSSCTKMRSTEQQLWPLLYMAPSASASAAFATSSTSART